MQKDISYVDNQTKLAKDFVKKYQEEMFSWLWLISPITNWMQK